MHKHIYYNFHTAIQNKTRYIFINNGKNDRLGGESDWLKDDKDRIRYSGDWLIDNDDRLRGNGDWLKDMRAVTTPVTAPMAKDPLKIPRNTPTDLKNAAASNMWVFAPLGW